MNRPILPSTDNVFRSRTNRRTIGFPLPSSRTLPSLVVGGSDPEAGSVGRSVTCGSGMLEYARRLMQFWFVVGRSREPPFSQHRSSGDLRRSGWVRQRDDLPCEFPWINGYRVPIGLDTEGSVVRI